MADLQPLGDITELTRQDIAAAMNNNPRAIRTFEAIQRLALRLIPENTEAVNGTAEQGVTDAAAAQASADTAQDRADEAYAEALTKQPADPALDSLSNLPVTNGAVEKTGNDTFVVRLIGTTTPASLLTLGDADARYAAAGAGVLTFNGRAGAVTLEFGDVTGALAGNLTGTGSFVRADTPTIQNGVNVTKGVAGSAGNIIIATPSDYGVGKPRFFIDNPSAATWRFGIFDTAVALGLTLSTTQATINGNFACNMVTSSGTANVISTANGAALIRMSSSIRFKTDVRNLTDEEGDVLFSLRPVTFRSTAGADDPSWWWLGLIAEEVAPLDARLAAWGYWPEDYETDELGNQTLKPDAQMSATGVNYDRLTILLINVVQRMQVRIDALEAALQGDED